MRKLPLLIAGLALAATAACSTNTTNPTAESSGDPLASGAQPTTSAAAKKPAATTPPKSSKLSDGGFVLESYTLKNGYGGDFDGTMRVTNTSGEAVDGASFTLTINVGSEQVGTIMGFANAVEVGKTITVQGISTDKYAKGPYKVDFQRDL